VRDGQFLHSRQGGDAGPVISDSWIVWGKRGSFFEGSLVLLPIVRLLLKTAFSLSQDRQPAAERTELNNVPRIFRLLRAKAPEDLQPL